MELCPALFGSAALHVRLVEYDSLAARECVADGTATCGTGDDAKEAGLQATHKVHPLLEALPPQVGVIDADKIIDRRALCTAALKALLESRNDTLHGRTLSQQLLFNLCPTRSLDKVNALGEPGSSESKELVFFSFDASALAAIDLAAIGVRGARSLEQEHIDYERAAADSARATRKLAFATKYYNLIPSELHGKPYWQIIASRIGAKGV